MRTGGWRGLVVAVLVSCVALACGDDDDGGGGLGGGGLGGGGGSSGGDAAEGSVADLLQYVPEGVLPEGGTFGDFVAYGSLARVQAALDLEAQTDVEDFLATLVREAGRAWIVAEPFERGALTGDFEAEVGFDLLDIDASLTAGYPPDDMAVLVGDFDPAAIDEALTTFPPFADELETGEQDGVTTYHFGEDGEIDLEQITAARPLGENLRLGVDDGVVLWTTSDATLEAAIDAGAGEGSLADDEGFAAVAAELDRAEASLALLTDDRDAHPAEGFGVPDDTPALAPWDTAALGEALTGSGSSDLLVVLWHADEAAAEANEEALARLFTEGTSMRSGRPWSELCTGIEVARDGAVVTGRCATSLPGVASTAFYGRDSLLAWR